MYVRAPGCAHTYSLLFSQFNVLWLNPEDPETFPPDLLDALIQETTASSEPDQLRRQMRADALQPVVADDGEPSPSAAAWPEEAIDEARQFIGQPVYLFILFFLN